MKHVLKETRAGGGKYPPDTKVSDGASRQSHARTSEESTGVVDKEEAAKVGQDPRQGPSDVAKRAAPITLAARKSYDDAGSMAAGATDGKAAGAVAGKSATSSKRESKILDRDKGSKCYGEKSTARSSSEQTSRKESRFPTFKGKGKKNILLRLGPRPSNYRLHDNVTYACKKSQSEWRRKKADSTVPRRKDERRRQNHHTAKVSADQRTKGRHDQPVLQREERRRKSRNEHKHQQFSPISSPSPPGLKRKLAGSRGSLQSSLTGACKSPGNEPSPSRKELKEKRRAIAPRSPSPPTLFPEQPHHAQKKRPCSVINFGTGGGSERGVANKVKRRRLSDGYDERPSERSARKPLTGEQHQQRADGEGLVSRPGRECQGERQSFPEAEALEHEAQGGAVEPEKAEVPIMQVRDSPYHDGLLCSKFLATFFSKPQRNFIKTLMKNQKKRMARIKVKASEVEDYGDGTKPLEAELQRGALTQIQSGEKNSFHFKAKDGDLYAVKRKRARAKRNDDIMCVLCSRADYHKVNGLAECLEMLRGHPLKRGDILRYRATLALALNQNMDESAQEVVRHYYTGISTQRGLSEQDFVCLRPKESRCRRCQKSSDGKSQRQQDQQDPYESQSEDSGSDLEAAHSAAEQEAKSESEAVDGEAGSGIDESFPEFTPDVSFMDNEAEPAQRECQESGEAETEPSVVVEGHGAPNSHGQVNEVEEQEEERVLGQEEEDEADDQDDLILGLQAQEDQGNDEDQDRSGDTQQVPVAGGVQVPVQQPWQHQLQPLQPAVVSQPQMEQQGRMQGQGAAIRNYQVPQQFPYPGHQSGGMEGLQPVYQQSEFGRTSMGIPYGIGSYGESSAPFYNSAPPMSWGAPNLSTATSVVASGQFRAQNQHPRLYQVVQGHVRNRVPQEGGNQPYTQQQLPNYFALRNSMHANRDVTQSSRAYVVPGAMVAGNQRGGAAQQSSYPVMVQKQDFEFPDFLTQNMRLLPSDNMFREAGWQQYPLHQNHDQDQQALTLLSATECQASLASIEGQHVGLSGATSEPQGSNQPPRNEGDSV